MNPTLARLLVRLGILGPDRLRVRVSQAPLRIEALLLVETTSGQRELVPFRIDSGCSISIISLALARSLQLLIPSRRIRRRRATASGRIEVEVLHGEFRFWLTEGQRAAPFVAPIDCDVTQPVGVPSLLGLKGVVNQIRWTIDGRVRPNEPAGCCILQDQRPAAQRYPS